MDKMNVSELEEDDTEELFDNSGSYDDLEAEAGELINEVFNNSYEPVYNPAQTKAKEERYRLAKAEENRRNKQKLAHHHKVYQNLEDKDMPSSLRQFLTRAQDKLESHSKWVRKMQQQRIVQETRDLKEVPEILRGSREKVEPIYERCLDLQKDKSQRLEQQRIDKQRLESQQLKNLSFRPQIRRGKQRTFEEYLADKEVWQQQRQEEVERKRLQREAQQLTPCTFRPNLVSKYTKPNSRLVPG
jgi:hypothetical protein